MIEDSFSCTAPNAPSFSCFKSQKTHEKTQCGYLLGLKVLLFAWIIIYVLTVCMRANALTRLRCFGDNCTQHEKQDLEKVQIEAARIVTGMTKLVSINPLYEESGWETLETRRKNHKLTFFFKMTNGISSQ